MSQAIEKLIKICPPPKALWPWEQTWDDVEAEIGLTLPNDYKRLMDIYGSGAFSGTSLISLREPVYESPSRDIGTIVESLMPPELVELLGLTLPFPLYPSTGGLLPFAHVGNEQNLGAMKVLCWLTEGEPNQWDVAYVNQESIQESGEVEVILFEGLSATEFLLQHLRGELAITHPDIPQPESSPNFKPIRKPPETFPTSTEKAPDHEAGSYQSGTQLDDLMRAIRDNPLDTDLRRVLSDWAEENGHSSRAKLIRLQLAILEHSGVCKDLSTRAVYDISHSLNRFSDARRSEIQELLEQEQRLIHEIAEMYSNTLGESWTLENLKEYDGRSCFYYQWDLGCPLLVCVVSQDDQDKLSVLNELIRRTQLPEYAWVSGCKLIPTGWLEEADPWKQVMDHPALKSITSLDVTDELNEETQMSSHVALGFLKAIKSSPNLGQLRSVYFRGGHFGEGEPEEYGLDALMEMRSRPDLRSLHLHEYVSPESLSRLITDAPFPNLECFIYRDRYQNPKHDAFLVQLASSETLENLRVLEVQPCRSLECVLAVVESSKLSMLTRFHCELERAIQCGEEEPDNTEDLREVLKQIPARPGLARFESFSLPTIALDEETVNCWITSPYSKQLKMIRGFDEMPCALEQQMQPLLNRLRAGLPETLI